MADKKTEFIQYLKGRFEVIRKDSDEYSTRGFCKAIEMEIASFLETD
ncbi:hypothetical protein LCGC14_2376250 [marine sediment metagenome]|uniref:Uncharacterized protein n=1 Tax=marine sediment metagenome TaxID=412755 RepID=A0A0F9C2B1_9ZZZZ